MKFHSVVNIFFYVLLLIAPLTVMAQREIKEEKIQIHGKVIESSDILPYVDSVMILNAMYSPHDPHISAAVVNGEFHLQVPHDITGRAIFRFSYTKQRANGDIKWYSFDEAFMIEDAIINILVDKRMSRQVNITGGRQNEVLNLYNAKKKEIEDRHKLADFQRDFYKERDTVTLSEYKRVAELVKVDVKKMSNQFIIDHPYAWHSLYLLDESVKIYLYFQGKNDPEGSEVKDYKKLFFGLDKPVRERGHYLLEVLQHAEAREVPSFTGEMPGGKTFDLTSLQGKVILIDFWGSWCASCRKGHPHLKELYKKYKDKGFEIVGVGTETGSREEQWNKFTKAIAYDGITWPQVLSDPNKRDLFSEFAIKTCPTKFLVDRNGKLLLRVGTDKDRLIDAKLEELFGE